MTKILLKKGDEVLGPCCMNDNNIEYNGVRMVRAQVEALGYTIEDYVEPRREWFIDPVNHTDNTYLCYRKTDRHCYIHVVELKQGEVIVDRKKVEDAWFQFTHASHIDFRKFCQDLGLTEEPT